MLNTHSCRGCRGHLGKKLMKIRSKKKFTHQTYGIELKELWEIKEEKSNPGEVFHSIGWPLDTELWRFISLSFR